ncbi:hypothetical protein [Bombilactobacillus bombi]|uniref:hypothetical protein n=1 Tax=Bombilactobacillus bombi TaxID=1303590 RepID=UPI0015E606EC|nr:hypothetical protein [Bombilactobacillus bombi]MBA1434304.1 hypothetical protein [Bombilactobacillus bombi]
MRQLLPAKKRTVLADILTSYPTKYTQLMLGIEKIWDISCSISLIFWVLSWVKINLEGWSLLTEVIAGLSGILLVVVWILDLCQRRHGKEKGKYWNYW